MANCELNSNLSVLCDKIKNINLINKWNKNIKFNRKCDESAMNKNNENFIRKTYFLCNNNKNKNNYFFILLLLFIGIFINCFDYGYAHGTILKSAADSNILNHHHHPSDFSKHTIIKPKIYHGRHKRSITNTLEEEDGLHATHLTLHYEHFGKNVIINLQRNDDMIPDGHFMRYQTPNGKNIVKKFTKSDVDHCHYYGTIEGKEDTSRVALSTCYGLSGIVVDDKETYYIKAGLNESLHDEHYLYSHNDFLNNNNNTKCGHTMEEVINTQQHLNINDIKISSINKNNRILRYKRSTSPETTIRGPYNANKHSSFVELVLVIDNKGFKNLGDSLKRVHHHCKEISNIINALYVPLNIFIALVGVVVWNEVNEIDVTSDGDKTLQNFLHYRRTNLVKNHPNDNAQLLTREQFDAGVVGKALKGPICTYEFSGGVSMDHSLIIGVVATTVAHEMGHNFGMEHDSPDCDCPDDRCIMSASSSQIAPRHWSSCSINQLSYAFHHGMDYCLKNKPAKLFDSPQCGNGFVEPGEQCDCGLPEYCKNSCCDPYTCMLHANASCATGECCDLNTCLPNKAGTLCRSKNGECDLPEYCTGESEYCPSDVFKRDTVECNSGKAFCYQGSCRSHTDQCKVLWGPSGQSSDRCYGKNSDATRHGNCGYNRSENRYLKCEQEDVLCGILHCRYLNERLEFGMESVALLSHSFIKYNDSVVPCRTAIIDLGLESVDPGLTPNGAKCGEDKMCVNQKCIDVQSLRASGMGVECPENCNGNGVCNSEGHCHCNNDYAPPFCKDVGFGGSIDSGPASDPNEHSPIARIMLIFFLGALPSMLLLAGILYYLKTRGKLQTKGKPTSSVSKVTKQNSSSPPSSGMPGSTPSSTDDMNSALLRTSNDTTETSNLNNNMFGKFKGFTLKPLPNATTPDLSATNVAFVHPVAKTTIDNHSAGTIIPTRIAPTAPKPPPSSIINRSQTQVKPIKPNVNRTNSTTSHLVRPNEINTMVTTSVAPALPPLNPGANPRPIISSPILEASTCTAKELLSPLKNTNKFPVRAAPVIPILHNTTNNEKAVTFAAKDDPVPPMQIKENKKSKDGALQKIASFLKKDEKPIVSVSVTPKEVTPPLKKLNNFDKEKLRKTEISAPIPQVEPTTPDTDDGDEKGDRTSVNRTQSMRDPSVVVKRPNIQTFGSMRQPGAKRPSSIVGSRPKSPPPPRPPAPPAITSLKIPGVPGYQNPPAPKKIVQNEYDDCEATENLAPLAHISEENSPTNSDNIYSVIDETPSPPKLLSPPETSASGSTESMGLLSEIVSEIENRNFDSIYSASTLNRKKKGKSINSANSDGDGDSEATYVNTSDVNDDSESDYSNVNNIKSNTSTTSSGYLRPSAINAPIARIAPSSKLESINTQTQASIKNASLSQTHESKPITNTLSSFKSVVPDNNNKQTLTNHNNNTNNNNNHNNNLNKLNTITFKGPVVDKDQKILSIKPAGQILPNSVKKSDEKLFKTNKNEKTGVVKATPPSPTLKKPLLNRTVTPPSIKPTTTAKTPVITSNKVIANGGLSNSVKTSPDVIPSIHPINKSKQPDVINNSNIQPIKPKPLSKPNITAKPPTDTTTTVGLQKFNRQNSGDKNLIKTITNKPGWQTNNLKNKSDNSTLGSNNKISGSIKNPTLANNVASLQQKFEKTTATK